MFCIHCGAKNDAANHFCMRCGQPLEPPPDEAPEPAAPVQEAEAPPPVNAPAPARGRKKPWIAAGLCLAAALCAGGVLAFLLLGGRLSFAARPALSLLIPGALGVSALIFGAAALILVLTGRERAQTTLEQGERPDSIPQGAACPCVVLADTNRPSEAVRVPLPRPVVIGRTEGECDLALPYEKSVSKRHCRVYAADGVVYLEDLGGRNGTYLNGAQVAGPTSLHTGDLIKLGRLVLRVTLE